MKQLLREVRRRIAPARRLTDATVRLFGADSDPVSRTRVETVLSSSAGLMARMLRRMAPGANDRLTATKVERKYDRMAGHYITKYYERTEQRGVYWVDGVLRETTREDHYRRMMNEYARHLHKVEFDSLLEVGAGELTTIAEMARRFGSDRTYHAIDLSFARVHRGRRFFDDLGADIVASRANAVRLPYADDSFDVVFTAHCLEHMPLDYGDAIDEMVRVARRAVVLFEPSYRLGDSIQKMRMRANGYARGIEDVLHRLEGVKLWPPRLMRNASAYNRTAVFGIHINRAIEGDQGGEGTAKLACPECHSPLRQLEAGLRCGTCQIGYPVIDGVADLGGEVGYSLAASRHSSSV